MRYTQLTEDDVRSMLARIGVSSIEDLLAPIPVHHRVDGPLRLPPALSEPELLAEMRRLAEANRHCGQLVCFLGAGCYDHFIPTVVDVLASRGEFLTAYTPYQPEASQGTLQAFFEFQTMICELTGMEVANASLYEFASSAAEAALMAHNITGRPRVLVSAACHPDLRAVVGTYLTNQPMRMETIAASGGRTSAQALEAALDEQTAAVIVQSPNFFGVVEDLTALADAAHRHGALLIVSIDPIPFMLLRRPGSCGADIVVGEGQSLGNPMSLGGPALGFLASRARYTRRMPGRIVGQTRDIAGRRAFCLTLQTREQHIRRARATSNVCTNQGLMALRAAIYMALLGQRGLTEVATQCLRRAHYLAERIAALDGYSLRFDAPFFREFVVRTEHPVARVLEHCRQLGILAGVPLGQWYPDLDDCFLVAVTEKRTRQEMDRLVEALKSV